MAERRTEELLSAYIDGELSPPEKESLERRLEESLELREQLSELQELSQQIRMIPRPYAPAEFRAEIMDRIDRLPVPRPAVTSLQESVWSARSIRRIAAWGTAVAAASFLLLIRWDGPQKGGPPDLLVQRDQLPAIAPMPKEISVPSPAMKSMPIEPASPAIALREESMILSSPADSVPPAAPGPESLQMHFSEGAASRKQAEKLAPTEPVQIVNVTKEEIRQRIDELERRPQRGNSIRAFGSLTSEEGETPIVVVFTVVDVIDAMNQMQVLVQRQQVRSRDNRVIPLNQDFSTESQLTAVTLELEMPASEMTAVLNSVAAVDAVIYREELPSENTRGLAQQDRGVSKPSSRSSPETGEQLVTRNRADGQQRYFSFEQISPLGDESSDRSSGRGDERLTMQRSGQPQRGGTSADDAGQPDAFSTPADSATNAKKSVPGDAVAAKEEAGFKLGREMKQVPSENSAPGEPFPRFRALVLLKQQTPPATAPSVAPIPPAPRDAGR